MPARPPHFLGIGPQRSGSSWLYAVLRRVPGVWLPPIKELHHWDADARPELRWGTHRRRRVRSELAALPGLGRLAHDAARPDLRFDVRYFTGRRSDAWYARLFAAAPPASVTGEITPSYFALHDDVLRRIRAHNPDIRIVTTLRQPVERAWSSVVKQEVRDRGLTLDQVPTAALVERVPTGACDLSFVGRWLDAFGPEQVLVLWYDDLVADPAGFLSTVLAHLGLGTVPPSVVGPVLDRVVNPAAGSVPPPPEFVAALTPRTLLALDALEERLGSQPVIERWRASLRPTVT